MNKGLKSIAIILSPSGHIAESLKLGLCSLVFVITKHV